jgi:hypothetical protein
MFLRFRRMFLKFFGRMHPFSKQLQELPLKLWDRNGLEPKKTNMKPAHGCSTRWAQNLKNGQSRGRKLLIRKYIYRRGTQFECYAPGLRHWMKPCRPETWLDPGPVNEWRMRRLFLRTGKRTHFLKKSMNLCSRPVNTRHEIKWPCLGIWDFKYLLFCLVTMANTRFNRRRTVAKCWRSQTRRTLRMPRKLARPPLIYLFWVLPFTLQSL